MASIENKTNFLFKIRFNLNIWLYLLKTALKLFKSFYVSNLSFIIRIIVIYANIKILMIFCSYLNRTNMLKKNHSKCTVHYKCTMCILLPDNSPIPYVAYDILFDTRIYIILYILYILYIGGIVCMCIPNILYYTF